MRFFPITAVFCLGAVCFGQPAPDAQRIDITVQRSEAGAWKAVPPGFIFKKGDHLRFQVRANFDGYLYVMNYGTSGQYTNLFPRQETGTENRIKSGADFLVPATGGSFRIDGPAGFDVVYWMLTPIDLRNGNPSAQPYSTPPPPYFNPAPPPPNPAPQTMHPRCDDTIMHARGLCIDSSAGPKNIAPDEKLPGNLSGISRSQSPDPVIINQTEGTSIATPGRTDAPILYKFLIAHE